MLTLSNLCRQLGINHPLEQTTCIGYGKAKPTCGRAVAQASRSAAATKLKEIVRKLTDGVAPNHLIRDLEQVSGLLHCKNYHQDQAAAKAQAWKLKLEQAVGESRRHQHSHHQGVSERSTAGRRHEPSTTEALDSCRTKDLLDELSNRLSNRRVIEAIGALLDEQYRATRTEPGPSFMHRPDYESDSESDNDDSGFYGSGAQSEEVADDSETDEDESMTSLRSSTSRLAQPSRTTSIHGSVGAHQQRRSPSPSPSVRDMSPSELEGSSTSGNACGICLMPLNSRSQTWRCGTCRNSAHVGCFDLWVASSPETNMKCIYW